MFKPNPNAMVAGGQALRKLQGYEGSALMNGPGIFKRSEREPAAWPCVAYKNTAKGTSSKSGSSPSLDIESAGPLDFQASRSSFVYYLHRLQYFVIVPKQACTILKINWAPAATVAGLKAASLPSSFLSSKFPSASLNFPLQQHLPVCLGRCDRIRILMVTGVITSYFYWLHRRNDNNRAVESPPLASRHMRPSCIEVSGSLWNLCYGTWHPTFQTAAWELALQTWP